MKWIDPSRWMVFLVLLSACKATELDDAAEKQAPAESDTEELERALKNAAPDDVRLAVIRANFAAQKALLSLADIDPEVLVTNPEDVEDILQGSLKYVQLSSEPSVDADARYSPKFECASTHGCPYTTKCPGAASCIVIDCGTGQCPQCPFWSNIAIRSWCSFVCLNGSTVTGSAFIINTTPFNVQLGPACLDP